MQRRGHQQASATPSAAQVQAAAQQLAAAHAAMAAYPQQYGNLTGAQPPAYDAAALYAQAQQMFAFPPFGMDMTGVAAAGAPAEVDVMATLPADTIKVSKTTESKALAGKLAHACRIGNAPHVVARGVAINTAVKGVAMACSFLKDLGVTLSCQCYHGNDGDNTTGRSVVFRIKKIGLTLPKPVTTTLKIGKNSKPASVAGSVATKIRQQENIAMQGIGPAAIEHATNSLILARRYLRDSNLDIAFTPSFVTVEWGDKTSSGIHWTITTVAPEK